MEQTLIKYLDDQILLTQQNLEALRNRNAQLCSDETELRETLEGLRNQVQEVTEKLQRMTKDDNVSERSGEVEEARAKKQQSLQQEIATLHERIEPLTTLMAEKQSERESLEIEMDDLEEMSILQREQQVEMMKRRVECSLTEEESLVNRLSEIQNKRQQAETMMERIITSTKQSTNDGGADTILPEGDKEKLERLRADVSVLGAVGDQLQGSLQEVQKEKLSVKEELEVKKALLKEERRLADQESC